MTRPLSRGLATVATLALVVAACSSGDERPEVAADRRPAASNDPTVPPAPPAGLEAWPESYRDFPKRPANTLTWAQDVAPILNEHCVTCHRPGGGAPFDLLTFDDARRRATEIATVTKLRFMPPWLPETGYNRFEGERALSVEEVGVLQQWIFEGMAPGDLSAAPATPEFPKGWELGEPDLVARLRSEYRLPAGGGDVFRTFVIPAVADVDRYVRGYQFRAANPSVVHHATVEVDRTRSARRLDAETAEPGFSGMRAEGAHIPDGHFVGWVPGRRPTLTPPSMSWRIGPDTDFVLKLHLIPSGKPEPVDVDFGMYLAQEPPTEVPVMIRLGRRVLDIPAGAFDYEIVDAYTLPVDVRVLAVAPHAHYLGHDLRGFATLPDGTRRWLLRIPDWDFNWQDEYRYVEPVTLPRGSVVAMRYSFDNSTTNIQNPHDPPIRVRFGPNTTDEMGDLWLQVMPVRPEERETLYRHYLKFDLERTIARYSVLTEETPDDVWRWNELGHHLSRAGRPTDAADAFRRALAIDPDYAYARRNLAAALVAMRDAAGAEAELRALLASDDEDAVAHTHLGNVLLATGRIDEGRRHLERAVALDPNVPATRDRLGRVYEGTGDFVSARTQFREAFRQDPTNLTAIYASAWIAILHPDRFSPDEALADARALVDASEASEPVALETLAAALAVDGRFDDAVSRAEEAIARYRALGMPDGVARGERAVATYRASLAPRDDLRLRF